MLELLQLKKKKKIIQLFFFFFLLSFQHKMTRVTSSESDLHLWRDEVRFILTALSALGGSMGRCYQRTVNELPATKKKKEEEEEEHACGVSWYGNSEPVKPLSHPPFPFSLSTS